MLIIYRENEQNSKITQKPQNDTLLMLLNSEKPSSKMKK